MKVNKYFEDVSSDKLLELDNMSEEEKKELLEMSEKNEKLDIYFKNWMEIVKYFYLIDVYKDYKNTFLDENNNFIETDESEINKFLLNLSEVDFENLDNAIQKLKSEIEPGSAQQHDRIQRMGLGRQRLALGLFQQQRRHVSRVE